MAMVFLGAATAAVGMITVLCASRAASGSSVRYYRVCPPQGSIYLAKMLDAASAAGQVWRREFEVKDGGG